MKLDDQIKGLLKRLGGALHHAMAKNEEVRELTNAIREEGYNLFLVMEANIALERKTDNKKGEIFFKSPETDVPIKLSKYDEEFLSGMQIKVDDT